MSQKKLFLAANYSSIAKEILSQKCDWFCRTDCHVEFSQLCKNLSEKSMCLINR